MHSPSSGDRQLSVRYQLSRADFSLDVNVEIASQGITGVFGSSGAGKTTLLRCMAGLEQPGSGRLVINGSVWEDSAAGIKRAPHERRIGYVFQEARLFRHLDVSQNLRYGEKRSGMQDSRIEFDHVVELLGLASFLKRSPATLSGGEAQRVAIGRALLRGPELILMDEPLASIDAARRDEVLPFIERLHADVGLPIIYVSHNIEEMCRICDQLAVMDGGRILLDGDLQSVLLQTEVPLLSGREAGVVISAKVEEFAAPDNLTRVATSTSQLWVPGDNGPPASELRLRVRANDVSLCLQRPQKTSILNVLEATVIRIQEEASGTVLVHVRAGKDDLLARVTRRSRSELSLEPGTAVFAQVKSIAVRASLC